MAEYIVDFFNIVTRLIKKFGHCVPFLRHLNKEHKECIVRCEDCKFCIVEDEDESIHFCLHWYDGTDAPYVTANGFCAWGERQ